MLESNWLAWMGQVTIFSAAACLLPGIFGVRHPRTQLAYCHAVLAACLLLPLVEPWQHPVVVQPAQVQSAAPLPAAHGLPGGAPGLGKSSVGGKSAASSQDSGATPRGVTPPVWPAIRVNHPLLWILALGAAVRLCWLLGSLWRIRRYRIAAMPLYPVPDSVRAAAALTHADALFCISSDVPGPVMLGWLAPVVLLPESFLALDTEAQCGIACHECLHVSRHDWLVTIFEELAGMLFWFHPAIWLLLAQTRLAREQLVDAEVVRLTAAREPYLDALLAIARGRTVLDLAPAPLFLSRRHLTHRMHSLLRDVRVSRFRLASSYSSIAAILAASAWFALASFPLIGRPQLQPAAAIRTATAGPSEPQAAQAPQPVLLAQQLPPRPEGQRAEPAASSVAAMPPDPHELVTSAIQVPTSPADRAVALALMQRAEQNSKLHLNGWTPPHRLDVSFTAGGNLDFTGPGTFSESWLAGQSWRWTTNLGTFSQVRIGFQRQPYDDKPVVETPLRVHMLRNAIFWAVQQIPSNAQIRTAQAILRGQPVTCVLTSQTVASAATGRLWEEEEFCMDEASGLLRVHSPAPGTYAIYSYSTTLFHNRSVPERIEIYVNGAMAIDAQVRMTDLDTADPSLFTPTPEMIAGGTALTEMLAQRITLDVPNAAARTIEPAVVVAELNAPGNAVEEELSSAANPALAAAALDLVKGTNFGQAQSHRQFYVNVRFVPTAQ